MTNNTQPVRVPKKVLEKVDCFSLNFNIPRTKAFEYRENILEGNFQLNKKKKDKTGKDIFELSFGGGFNE